MTINFKYNVGDTVEVRGPGGDGWHKSVILRLEPYRGAPGYYVLNTPVRAPSEGSAGGWVYEAVMRKVEG